MPLEQLQLPLGDSPNVPADTDPSIYVQLQELITAVKMLEVKVNEISEVVNAI